MIDSTINREELDNLVLKILGKESPLSMAELENRIATHFGRRIDTFTCRDSVWRLIGKYKVDFTPIRDVKIVRENH